MTNAALRTQILATLAQFSGTNRLYELSIGDDGSELASADLLVEAFVAEDALDDIGIRHVLALSTDNSIELTSLLGKPASLYIRLADGSRTRFAGEISEAAMLGSDGGFTRYRISISPWLWRLSQVRTSRVWQDRTVIEIVDAVFAPYQPLAAWRWSEETAPFMERAMSRSYCCQYRESDLDFVRRILAEEGLCWRFEQTDAGPVMVLFADSSQLSAVPEDASSKFDGGIRYHGVNAVDPRVTVQALATQRRLHVSLTTLLSPDYKSKQVFAAGSPSRLPLSATLPALESFDIPGQYAYSSRAHAMRYADIQMQGREARSQFWRGRSTVRTLQAGTRMVITGAPRKELGDRPAFTILRVKSVGVNNLPSPAQHALAELFGPIPELLQECVRDPGPPSDDLALVIEQARKTGYANCFEAIPAALTWRPQLPGSDGRSHPKPTAFGAQSATVIGADGSDFPNGADELYCDRLGRVRIRFHWQDDSGASCWVRVAQRSAGGGMGSQFLPRIGQEVLVQFLENDIDRPVIIGALYNGRGEGGVARTPGGKAVPDSGTAVFDPAHDHAPSGQGNLAGGNSPAWHGAASGSAGHRNAAAQWGVRSKEFGGSGYSQLLFDDTDAQGRVQLRSTHAATELNLGHLIHSADNYRGSFRGQGAELRTDAYGAVRAGAGVLLSSYGIGHDALSRDPAGDNVAGIAIMKQAVKLAEAFHATAVTHQTVGLAAHVGAVKANASTLDDKAAPLSAMLAAVSGMAGDAGKLPYPSAPIITVAAKAGLGLNASQSMQLANGETVTLMSGQDTQFVTGGQMRLHTGQAIGMLGGAVKTGESGIGLQLIAARDPIDVQAQNDELNIQARDEINVVSANAHVDWAAARRISLSTADGANITIEGGNITVQCPGKITIHAGKKNFSGPTKGGYDMPPLPRSICLACLKKSLKAGLAFTMVE